MIVAKKTAIITAADTQIRTNERLSFRGIFMEDIMIQEFRERSPKTSEPRET
ncbi:hypothetical protein [Brevundimonas sp.]|uniref:hypothetical protein n=1 Tax=Brevundimonas sp. TaxID=1871086 RepID=UPI0025C2CE4F|nr:hypothetical protein [Brevundimonas sp.]